jgi:hypothetical protein
MTIRAEFSGVKRWSVFWSLIFWLLIVFDFYLNDLVMILKIL